MRNVALAVVVFGLGLAVAANAQIYKWQDEHNKTVISDRPPPVKARQAKAIDPEASSEPAPAQAPTANAEAGKTMADRELEFRKRQKESKDAAEKAEKEQRLETQKKEACEAARNAVRVLESGQRVATRDDKGERVVLDDAQRERELAKARRNVETSCK